MYKISLSTLLLWACLFALGFAYQSLSVQNPEKLTDPGAYYKKYDTVYDDNDWSKRWFIYKSKNHAIARLLIQYPFSGNLAWIVLASILNFTNTVFNYEEYQKNPVIVGGADWATGVAILATLIGIFLSYTRQDAVYNYVLMWALNGIRLNQSADHETSMPPGQVQNENLSKAAALCMGLVAIGIIVGWVRSFAEFLYWKNYAAKDHELNSHASGSSVDKPNVEKNSRAAAELTGV
jgi:hypothetical protein